VGIKLKNMKTKWICTDPDNEQYGRHIKGRTYEFKETMRFPSFEAGEIINMIIDLNDYTEEETLNHISPYYDNIDEVKEIYGDDWEWVVAECIFEQESGQY
jgi:hypothetical protein